MGLLALMLGAATACGSSASSPDGKSPTEAGPDAQFCRTVDGIEADLELLDLARWDEEAQRFASQVATASERFSTTKAPESIAEAWDSLRDFFAMTDQALEGVDVTKADELRQALRFDGDDAFAMMLRLPGEAETVGLFIQDACEVDLGIEPPAITNVCETLDPTHLGSVFDGSVPDGEHRNWGVGVVECFWDDGDGKEIGVVVGPAESMRDDVLQNATVVDQIKTADGTIEVYDGALGPLRAAAGRTAAIEAKGTAVVASARTGDTSAEAQKAVALVELVVVEIG